MKYEIIVEEKWFYQVEADSVKEAKQKVLLEPGNAELSHSLSRKVVHVCAKGERKR